MKISFAIVTAVIVMAAAPAIAATPIPFPGGSLSISNDLGTVTFSDFYNGSGYTKTDIHIVLTDGEKTWQVDRDLPQPTPTGSFVMDPVTNKAWSFKETFGNPPIQASLSVLSARWTPGVPEPNTWTMLIVGFAALGGMLRRRKASYRIALA